MREKTSVLLFVTYLSSVISLPTLRLLLKFFAVARNLKERRSGASSKNVSVVTAGEMGFTQSANRGTSGEVRTLVDGWSRTHGIRVQHGYVASRRRSIVNEVNLLLLNDDESVPVVVLECSLGKRSRWCE